MILPEDKECVIRALRAVGAEEFVELEPAADGVRVQEIEENREYVAVAIE